MPKLHLVKATTSKLTYIFVPDSSSSVGAGLTGLAFNTASLTGYYYREGAGSATAITLATSTLGTFTSGAFKEVSSTNMPGLYEVGIPDAALATGANSVIVMYKGAANMVPVVLEIQLTDVNLHDAVRLGLTALPNAAAGATNGLSCFVINGGTAQAGAGTTITLATSASTTADLYKGQLVAIISGAGAGQSRRIAAYSTGRVATVEYAWATNPDNTSVYEVTASRSASTDVNLKVQGVVLTDTVTTYTGNTVQTGDAFARLGAPVGASISADIAGVQADTDNLQTRIPAALVSGRMDASVGAMAANVMTAAAAAADLTTELQAGLATSAALATVQSDTDDIQSRLPAALVSGRMDASVGAMAVNTMTAAAAAADLTTELQAGLATSAALAAVQADTDDIQTRLPAALVGGRIDANVGAISGDSTAADNEEAFFDGTGYAGTNNVIPSVTTVTGNVNGSVASVATNGITSGSLDATAAVEIAAAVWNETRASHLADGSFGQALQLIRSGTAQAGAGSAITLDAGAAATDDFYNNGLIQILAGTGAPQARYITDYVGATKVATVSAWVTAPDNTSVFVIQPGDAIPGATAPTAAQNAAAVWDEARSSHTTSGTFGQGVASVQGNVTGSAASVTGNVGGNVVGTVASVVGNVGGNVNGSVGTVATGGITSGSIDATAAVEIAGAVWEEQRTAHVTAGSFGQTLQLIRTGTAQAATSTTVTLDASASAINDFYNDNRIEIIAGTGIGQSRFISDYVGTSKVATIAAVWSTTPDATSVFSIEGFGSIPGVTAPTAVQNAAAVWGALRVDYGTVGTFGQGVASVQGNVTGSVASVTGNVGGNLTGTIGSLAPQAKADVNAEVVDVLTVDTVPELAQGQPATLPTFASAVMTTYMAFRNQSTQGTSGVNEYTNNAGTVIFKRTTTDDGTTLTRPKLVSGP